MFAAVFLRIGKVIVFAAVFLDTILKVNVLTAVFLKNWGQLFFGRTT